MPGQGVDMTRWTCHYLMGTNWATAGQPRTTERSVQIITGPVVVSLGCLVKPWRAEGVRAGVVLQL